MRVRSSTIAVAHALLALACLCGSARGANAVGFDAVVLVSAGDVIDFAVGFGPNGSFSNDTTGLAATLTLGGIVADAAADFSPTSNPNGVWRYGWTAGLGTSFVLSTHPAVRDGIDTWRGDIAGDGNPGAYHNGTTHLIVLGTTARMEPGQFALHPGPGGQYAVLRYVAPQAGSLSIDSEFSGLDVFGTTTDVHVLWNGASLFDGVVVDVPEPTGAALIAASATALVLVQWLRRGLPRRTGGS